MNPARNNNEFRSGPIDAVTGSLLGCALGDSIGLPFEGISARRIRRLNPGPLEQRLVFGYGMISDDTEHSCLVAQALIACGGDAETFGRNMAWRLRWWFLTLPAGIGLGTLRSAIKLWLGFPYHKSGANSAGNGPMMRSAIIGAYAGRDDRLREDLVAISSRITHSDPRAERAAQVIACATALALENETVSPARVEQYFEKWSRADEALKSLLQRAAHSASDNQSAQQFCDDNDMSKGVSGLCYSTLAVVLQIWFRHYGDAETAITEAVRCGGDTDTVAAIIGGMVGARVGRRGLPQHWLRRLTDWPRSVEWMESLCAQLNRCKAAGTRQRPKYVIFPFALIRNLLFILVVLAHGFRRLAPPY
ncbi:MAG: ADP-ribosylglycohydrolase family protein [Gammaproteobacteria bacterium]|nr:ADP-ribosylglycohydrolase family protein [Gammaproteobacteria bacterium]